MKPDKILEAHANICQGSQPMPRVRLMLPEVNKYPDACPLNCPYCAGVAFHKQASLEKRINDLYIKRVTAVRYKCADCGRTFRRYPSGVDGHAQSKRLRAVAALSWALGLSHRSVGHLLTALGCELARMSSCEMYRKRESAR